MPMNSLPQNHILIFMTLLLKTTMSLDDLVLQLIKIDELLVILQLLPFEDVFRVVESLLN